MHAQILFAYLPVAQLDHMVSESSKHHASQNLFHACMRHILRPLEMAGVEGVQMKSSDGLVHQCHPILAVYAGNHPEQCLISCTKITECPKGTPSGPLRENVPCHPHDIDDILEALEVYDPVKQPKEYAAWCSGMGRKPVLNPFWNFSHMPTSTNPSLLTSSTSFTRV